jgi:hypothetical protein
VLARRGLPLALIHTPPPANNNVHKSQKGAVEEEKEAVDAYVSGLSPRKPRSGHARRPPKERFKKLQAQR